MTGTPAAATLPPLGLPPVPTSLHKFHLLTVDMTRPSRREDVTCIASLQESDTEQRSRLARLDAQLIQMKAELLLREDSYNKRFASAGGAAGTRVSVSRAQESQDEMIGWMMGSAGAAVPVGSRQPGSARRNARA